MAERILGFDEYRTLTEQAPILIWRANTATECDYFNQRWLEFTGRTLEQELGNGWAEGVHVDDFQRCLNTYLEAFADRKAFEMEYRLLRHDGVYRWIFDRGAPFYNDDGSFAGYIGSCIDITEQVEGREAIRIAHENEIERLRNLLPICSVCKKVRNDSGFWQEVELYLLEKSDILCSHGLCPSCFTSLYPDLADKISKEVHNPE
ncbi:MAG: PAS domain-containing protein [Geobacteraceae bacterium]|nr:PAS domain-containing protein [Geobacteraceae bacterium]